MNRSIYLLTYKETLAN